MAGRNPIFFLVVGQVRFGLVSLNRLYVWLHALRSSTSVGPRPSPIIL